MIGRIMYSLESVICWGRKPSILDRHNSSYHTKLNARTASVTVKWAPNTYNLFLQHCCKTSLKAMLCVLPPFYSLLSATIFHNLQQQPPPQALRFSHRRGERETRVTGDEPQGTMGRVSFPPSFARTFSSRERRLGTRQLQQPDLSQDRFEHGW